MKYKVINCRLEDHNTFQVRVEAQPNWFERLFLRYKPWTDTVVRYNSYYGTRCGFTDGHSCRKSLEHFIEERYRLELSRLRVQELRLQPLESPKEELDTLLKRAMAQSEEIRPCKNEEHRRVREGLLKPLKKEDLEAHIVLLDSLLDKS